MKKTNYEILGLPRTATEQQIKKRYRLLVRQHHPDVAEDKEAANAAFIEISEAYQTLINADKRMIYDSSLDAEMFRVQTRRPASTGAGTRRTTTRTSRASDAERWVRDAQSAFIRGQFLAAIDACKQAQRLDQKNVKAYTILGDVYGVQGKTEEAISMYTIAVQLDPRNQEILAKLNRLMRKQGAVGGEKRAFLKAGLSLISCSFIALAFVILGLNPGEPVQWIAQSIPYVNTWSTALLSVMLVVGVLVGFMLSVSEVVQSLDDELVFPSVRAHGTRTVSYPVALILLAFNLFNFYLAAAMYTIIGLIQESLSKSVMCAFMATFFLVLMTSVIYWPGSTQVLIFGGNVVFPAVLLGWAIGDMSRFLKNYAPGRGIFRPLLPPHNS